MAGDHRWTVARVSERDEIRDTYRAYTSQGRERLWDRSNPGFSRLIEDRDRALRDLFARSLPTGAPRLLDVGCGDGTHVSEVVSRWPDVHAIGLDLLEERIDEARAKVPDASFAVGSADELPFDDASFDVVAAITLFSSLPSVGLEHRAAREIERVMRPGGWLVWFDLRYDNPSNRAVHGLPAARINELFPGWHRELRSITLAPPIARRLGPTTPILYPVLHAVPLLRTHLIGRLRCPS